MSKPNNTGFTTVEQNTAYSTPPTASHARKVFRRKIEKAGFAPLKPKAAGFKGLKQNPIGNLATIGLADLKPRRKTYCVPLKPKNGFPGEKIAPKRQYALKSEQNGFYELKTDQT